ncbi:MULTISPECIES: hypothetical protein [unclassified Neglectibacter]|uniref:hypothetical protein n=1 Tax=unclassified Neglectibacter TaxID=2632164 RepID=UPI0013695DFF|nr:MULTISPECIES: hypothetical protein [unclassified Neglectibacter]
MHPKTRDAVFSGHFRGRAVVSALRELTAGEFCGMMKEARLCPERPLPARAQPGRAGRKPGPGGEAPRGRGKGAGLPGRGLET